MPCILCLEDMIAGIDANPPVTDEEFAEAIAHWREEERKMPRVKGGSKLDLSLAMISRVEIESILRTRKIREDSLCRYASESWRRSGEG